MAEEGDTPCSRNLKLLREFPSDLRSAHRALHIEPDTIEYAACSKCNTIYPPKKSGKILEWPTECMSRHFWDSPICGQVLVKSAVDRGESIRVPMCPFVVQDFNSFTGRLLCRPGYEQMLDRGTVLSKNVGKLWDIKDGAAIRDLKGPDGKPFLDGLKRSELVLGPLLSNGLALILVCLLSV